MRPTSFHPNPQILIVCDHASNAVPADIALGIEAALLQDHIAWDIGTADLGRALAARLNCPAILAPFSRLVADCNRLPENCVPASSDGHAIPGNVDLAPTALAQRLAIHTAYHEKIAAHVAEHAPQLIISIHSFTPRLQSAATDRPWPMALLWNRDDRAARLALATLQQESDLPGPVGANEPYSGRTLNYTMDRHAEANGIPYLTYEVRQDQLPDADCVARYADILHRASTAALAGLTTTKPLGR